MPDENQQATFHDWQRQLMSVMVAIGLMIEHNLEIERRVFNSVAHKSVKWDPIGS